MKMEKMYQVIMEVNLNDGNAKLFRLSAFPFFQEGNWDTSLRLFCDTYLSEEQHEQVITAFSLVSLSRVVEEQSAPLRLPVSVAREGETKKMELLTTFVGVRRDMIQITLCEENQKQMLNDILARFFYRNCDYFSLIDVHTKGYTLFGGNRYTESAPRAGRDYTKLFANYAEMCVFPEDRTRYMDFMCLERTVSKIKKRGVVSVDYRIVGEDGTVQEKRLEVSDYDEQTGCVMVYQLDVSGMYEQELEKRQKLSKELEQVKTLSFTGIPNAAEFYRRTREMLNKHPEKRFVMVRFDLDRFKIFNDIFGVKAGDRLLADLASLLTSIKSDWLTYGHIEADHFAFCVPQEEAKPDDIIAWLVDWFSKYPVNFAFVPSVGIYDIHDPSVEVSLMCDRALLALKAAKHNYRASYSIYQRSMRDRLVVEQELSGEAREALLNGEFQVWYQPQYNYQTKRLVGAEALVRWQHPKRGMLYPGSFVDLFETNGFITELDLYVFEEVCKMLREWLDRGYEPVVISTNISRMDIYRTNLCAQLKAISERYRIPQKYIKIEITESAYMENAELVISTVKQIQELGFQVAMDDFGSGFSSLNALKDMTVDLLKLDMRFLALGQNENRGGSIISSVVRMARWIEQPVIAEGVETKEQADFLVSVGCELMQGYYFSKPINREAFEEVFQKEREKQLSLEQSLPEYQVECDKACWEGLWRPSSGISNMIQNYARKTAIVEDNGRNLDVLVKHCSFAEDLSLPGEMLNQYHCDFMDLVLPEEKLRMRKLLEDALRLGEASLCFWMIGLDAEKKSLRIHLKFLAENKISRIFYMTVEQD